MEKDVQENKECHLKVLDEHFAPQLIGVAYPKNSPHRRSIDNRLEMKTINWNLIFKKNIPQNCSCLGNRIIGLLEHQDPFKDSQVLEK